jgi:formate dehydrogenase
VLPEPEIHARLVEAMGLLPEIDLAPLRAAAAEGRDAFAQAFFAATAARPQLGALAPVVLYRTLGPGAPRRAASARSCGEPRTGVLSRSRRVFAPQGSRERASRSGRRCSTRSSRATAASRSRSYEWDDVWRRVSTDDGRIHLAIPDLLDELSQLESEPAIATRSTRSCCRR